MNGTSTKITLDDVYNETLSVRAKLQRIIDTIEARPEPRLLPDPGIAELKGDLYTRATGTDRLIMWLVFAIGLLLGAQIAVFLGWVL